MNIGYIHLDYGEWTTGSYNIQEIGLAKVLEQMGHQTTIVYWMSPKDRRCGTEVNTTSNIKKVYLPYKRKFVLAKRQLALCSGSREFLPET